MIDPDRKAQIERILDRAKETTAARRERRGRPSMGRWYRCDDRTLIGRFEADDGTIGDAFHLLDHDREVYDDDTGTISDKVKPDET